MVLKGCGGLIAVDSGVTSDHDLLIRIRQILDSFISEVDRRFIQMCHEHDDFNTCIKEVRAEIKALDKDSSNRTAEMATRMVVLENNLKHMKKDNEEEKNAVKDRTATWLSIAAIVITMLGLVIEFMTPG
ncbi:MAG: hypothetical protein M0R06_07980 [Sphaerochaeta sp.]|jgi:arginine deiminase|nr:hypothetical protein [Sphaerochaeta sp.]